jgi:hypothetical protein
VASPAEQGHGRREIDFVAVVHRNDLAAPRHGRAQVGGCALRGQHERPLLECRVRRVERAAGGDERHRRLLWTVAQTAQLRERGRRRRVNTVGKPRPRRRGEHRPRADEDDVGDSAEESHHEAIGLTLARDQRVRARELWNRHDAVDRLDEVGEQGGFVDPERPAVERAQLRRQVELGRRGGLEEQLERRQRRLLTSARNSARRSAWSS